MADKDVETPVEELSFKEASIELEQVVRSLESGDLELEDALARYARGVELLKSLRESSHLIRRRPQTKIRRNDV